MQQFPRLDAKPVSGKSWPHRHIRKHGWRAQLEEIQAGQALRYQVFVEEMQANVSAECHRVKRGSDAWDLIRDHLVVVFAYLHRRSTRKTRFCRHAIVSCGHPVAMDNGGFYSSSEFAS